MHFRTRNLATAALIVGLSTLNFVAAAQAPPPVHLTGLINDYGPSNVKGGPYEMHGTWSLDLHGHSGTADFSAAMAMETSDYGTLNGNVTPSDPGSRGAHTHHIVLRDATVSFDATGCPDLMANPATKSGFQITGTVSLMTGNGNVAPFETTPLSSRLQICVTGASEVEFSNITLVFLAGSPAIKHFGPYPIHGVVLNRRANHD